MDKDTIREHVKAAIRQSLGVPAVEEQEVNTDSEQHPENEDE